MAEFIFSAKSSEYSLHQGSVNITQKKKDFITQFLYYGIIIFVCILALKYILPMITPFALAVVLSYLLKKPIGKISERLHLTWKQAAMLTVLGFFATIGLLTVLICIETIALLYQAITNLPHLYSFHIEPLLSGMFLNLEQLLERMAPSLALSMDQVLTQTIQSLGQMISGLSMTVMGAAPAAAATLPKIFIESVLFIISTFFISMDYHRLTSFCFRQMNENTRNLVLQIKEYVVGTLFGCIRSYALIMSFTFVELSLGFSILGLKHPMLVAFCIALFDILPVLGTGGVMIPWFILAALRGEFTLSLGLLAIYLFVTVVRNILEPKIVGNQIGLHPVVTLTSLYLGGQLFGVIGLFGLPILISLLRHLNENGTIKIFK